jgi:ketosteroid isomerase-like protein
MDRKHVLVMPCVLMCVAALASEADALTDDQIVTKLIQETSHAMAALPKTKDVKGVLQYLAQDYTFIDEGELRGRKELEATLRDLQSQKPSGEVPEIKDEVTHIQVHVAGDWAWAVYDEVVIITVSGQTVDEDDNTCTGIFRKTGQRWLYVHEHCSEGGDADPSN